jgi:hypothetical protein
MTTDAKTGQPIFSHHTSVHTRNRRPFALQDDNIVASKQAATTVTPVAAAALNDSLNDATAGENGYVTGNARFLSLYAYNYAFGAWAQYYINIGVGDTETAAAAFVAATWTTIDGKFMITVPIHGIDRIGFVHDGTLNDMVVRAACSTF